ncbi:CsbD family protein [Paraburkholderia sp. J41]|nr:CsbD family protein [Paraburkholderia sp. J41]
MGAVTRDENKKLEGEAQIVEGDNLKDYGDQKENIEKGKTRPGDPTNL